MNTKTIHEIIEYIEEHITEVISLNEIGKMINYSPYYCSASFRKHVGTSIKNYIRRRRLQLASKDLRETKMRIIDVAFKYCYSSQEAFSRAFVECFGVTPFEMSSGKRANQSMKNESIRNIQGEISGRYPVNVLHVLNGTCMLDEFKRNGHLKENSIYISFNEAMCWGDADEELFSDVFIEKRVKALNTTVTEYKNIVLQSLEPMFLNGFDTIVLWFGTDMFCQINMLTILAYLDNNNFSGDVLYCLKNEIIDDMLPEAYEIDITGSYERYKRVLCENEMPEHKMLLVMYQAVSLYLNYRAESSEIKNYIRKNVNKERNILIQDLLNTFPQYGLGDLQYDMMITNIINDKV